MTDIVIYTNPKVVDHKRDRAEYICFWEMGRLPKDIKIGDRVFFAYGGLVMGSFRVKEITRDDDGAGELEWSPYTWRYLDPPVRSKPFRGFRYRWWNNGN